MTFARPGRDGRHTWGRRLVFGTSSVRSPRCMLSRPVRSEPSWSSIHPQPTCAIHTVGRCPSLPDRGRPMSGVWDRDEAGRFVEELFAKHHGEIYAYLFRMMRDPEVAADMTQDAFIKAYKNYDTLEKPENARAWLYQIAHRVALDEIRRRKIVRFLPWTGESKGSAPSAEHLVMDARLSGDLAACAGPDPRATAGRALARRAARPDRARAGRRARREPRRGSSPADARPRDRCARHSPPSVRPTPRPRPRARRARDVAARRGSTDEPLPTPAPPTRPLVERPRAGDDPAGRAARWPVRARRSRRGSTSISPVARRAPRSRLPTRTTGWPCAACATMHPNHRATCGHGRRRRSRRWHRTDRRRRRDARRLPIGALSGVMVVALVVGVSLLSGSLTIQRPPRRLP